MNAENVAVGAAAAPEEIKRKKKRKGRKHSSKAEGNANLIPIGNRVMTGSNAVPRTCPVQKTFVQWRSASRYGIAALGLKPLNDKGLMDAYYHHLPFAQATDSEFSQGILTGICISLQIQRQEEALRSIPLPPQPPLPPLPPPLPPDPPLMQPAYSSQGYMTININHPSNSIHAFPYQPQPPGLHCAPHFFNQSGWSYLPLPPPLPTSPPPTHSALPLTNETKMKEGKGGTTNSSNEVTLPSLNSAASVPTAIVPKEPLKNNVQPVMRKRPARPPPPPVISIEEKKLTKILHSDSSLECNKRIKEEPTDTDVATGHTDSSTGKKRKLTTPDADERINCKKSEIPPLPVVFDYGHGENQVQVKIENDCV